jgi:hypothetical protein
MQTKENGKGRKATETKRKIHYRKERQRKNKVNYNYNNTKASDNGRNTDFEAITGECCAARRNWEAEPT